MSHHTTVVKETKAPNAAQQQTDAFCERFGQAHFLLACHAALSVSLTPELVYGFWANFQTDNSGQLLDIPWEATSDLLLSDLCDEVGKELYEIELSVREYLISVLQEEATLGDQRIRQVAKFLNAYAYPKLNSENQDERDFSQTQQWTALAYLEPEKASQELKLALSQAVTNDQADLTRIASVVESLRTPLADYPDLLSYARGLFEFSRGNFEKSAQHLDHLREVSDGQIVASLSLPNFYKQQPKSPSIRETYQDVVSASIKASDRLARKIWKFVWPQGVSYALATVISILGITRLDVIWDDSTIPQDYEEIISESTSTDDLKDFQKSPINNDFDKNEKPDLHPIHDLDKHKQDQIDEYQVTGPEQDKLLNSETQTREKPELRSETSIPNSQVINDSDQEPESQGETLEPQETSEPIESQPNSVAINSGESRNTIVNEPITGTENGSNTVLQETSDPTEEPGPDADGLSNNPPRVMIRSSVPTASSQSDEDPQSADSEVTPDVISHDNTIGISNSLPLKLGSQGPVVEELQRQLNDLSLLPDTGITGFYDEDTRQAVRQFQQNRRLAVTGIADLQTLGFLGFNVASSPTGELFHPIYGTISDESVNRDSSRDDIGVLQQALQGFGFNVSVDGVYGPMTQQAVRSYQRTAEELSSVSGMANRETLISMGFEPTRSEPIKNQNLESEITTSNELIEIDLIDVSSVPLDTPGDWPDFLPVLQSFSTMPISDSNICGSQLPVGQITLGVVIDADGSVIEFFPSSGENTASVQTATCLINQATNVRFAPARTGGQNVVTDRLQLTLQFKAN